MASHPFLLLKQSTATLLENLGSTALSRWAADWTALSRASVACVAASDSPLSRAENLLWQQQQLGDGSAVWLHLPAGLPRYLEHTLFHLEQADATSEKHLSSKLGMSVVNSALADLLTDLLQALTGQAAAPAPGGAMPSHLWRRGSGAVLCTINLGDLAINLMLPVNTIASSKAATPSTAPRPALTPLKPALASVAIKLSVEISQVELTLGQMRTLAVGDVLALPTHLDEAIKVRGPGGAAICHAHLGNLHGMHAVELIKQTR